MNKNIVKKWFVVQIKPNAHDMAFRNLERQGFEAFGPKMKITIKKENKFINKDVLVFPGYMFVGVDTQSSNWIKINSTFGVAKVLSFNERASDISHNLILALKNRYQSKNNQKIKKNVKEGDRIKFDSGPFVNLIAKIETVHVQDRISLILEVMGGNRKLKFQQTEELNFTKV